MRLVPNPRTLLHGWLIFRPFISRRAAPMPDAMLLLHHHGKFPHAFNRQGNEGAVDNAT
jgi:hypothetical protein